ncbi:hypothetical protein I8752_02840 [Nostocaceae cyanobacterium CENA369]|uniref:Uncharacterized protein n=1 Tax=Dendronalium phyllosphericum CENA369 TaxID=1725256 RepID=A0A8J7I274_9NOST|nr:hypothetical protein [Dendronalium phyllosphericum]MBH8571985.1 hypothetical protein [Dendronalium phyllosphericum CENA369]
MKVKVTEQGVVIPKEFLEGVQEVEIRKENNLIVVITTIKSDPIFEMGMNPISCGVTDASEQTDVYIYGSGE